MIIVVSFQSENITLRAYQFLGGTTALHALIELIVFAMFTHLALFLNAVFELFDFFKPLKEKVF